MYIGLISQVLKIYLHIFVMNYMTITTIRVHGETKKLLGEVRANNRETYEDIIKKLIEFYTKKD